MFRSTTCVLVSTLGMVETPRLQARNRVAKSTQLTSQGCSYTALQTPGIRRGGTATADGSKKNGTRICTDERGCQSVWICVQLFIEKSREYRQLSVG